MIWLLAFLWTLALELPIYMAILGKRGRSIALAFAVNAVTHPLLWFAFPRFDPYWHYVLAGELCVVATEALLIALVIGRVRRAIVASIVANSVSTVLGTLILRLFT